MVLFYQARYREKCIEWPNASREKMVNSSVIYSNIPRTPSVISQTVRLYCRTVLYCQTVLSDCTVRLYRETVSQSANWSTYQPFLNSQILCQPNNRPINQPSPTSQSINTFIYALLFAWISNIFNKHINN